ncbi:NXPE family member 3-like [Mercenaria mercenaria]|uniref:NXPE family member 3-like n=1 Tax=Mercenaria mercenaria TaxID=6596 RepID=UPI00234F8B58|nr:NXPE family member 3-like [Mercenaria mercenaria]
MEQNTSTGLQIAPSGTLAFLKRQKTLGFIIFLNACFMIAYIINYQYLTEGSIKSRDLVDNNSGSPQIILPAFCRGIQTSNKYSMTSTAFSRASSEVVQGTSNIVVNIETFNKKNVKKSRGGDIIFVWANQPSGDGRVPGKVIDHGNGSYTGMIRVFWKGRTKIYVRLVSTAENTCLRYKALKKYGNIVYTLRQPYGLRAIFVDKNVTELTPCNTNNFIYGSSQLCNFTTLNGGMSWFCGHPTRHTFRCTDLNFFSLGPFNSSAESPKDKIQDPGHGMFKEPMTVNVRSKSPRNTTESCREQTPSMSWTEPSPTGYYLKRHWEPANCHTALMHTVKSYRSCLRNKTLIMLGDSTVRQYVNFFLKDILDFDSTIGKGLTFGPNFETYHGRNTFTNHGITIIYRKQAMPLHFSGDKIPINNILSFPQILDSITADNISDSSIIVLLNYHTHFTAFPPEKYRERVRHLVESLKRFFITKPSAKVFFKGPSACIANAKWWDPQISLLYKKILKEEFVDVMDKVTYLNIWEIGVAHNVQDVHPHGDALKSQIHQFMSFIC